MAIRSAASCDTCQPEAIPSARASFAWSRSCAASATSSRLPPPGRGASAIATLRQKLADAIRGLPSLSLLSLVLLVRKRRAFLSLQADVVRMHRAELERSLPPISPAQLCDHAGPYTLHLGQENIEYNELEDLLLMKLVAMLRPMAVFEIGTFLGTRTALFASQEPQEMRIYTLDLPPDDPPPDHATDAHIIQRSRIELGRKFRDTPWAKRITQLFGDSASFDFSPYQRAMDLVYIDGSHSYPYVVSDTHNAMDMIRPGGVLLWDDYGSMRSEYGTTRYLEKLHASGYPAFRLGTPDRRSALRGRAVMRPTQDVIERFARERPE